jgi:hypothetical protein
MDINFPLMHPPHLSLSFPPHPFPLSYPHPLPLPPCQMIHHSVYCDPEEDKPPPSKKPAGRWSVIRRAAANMRSKSGWDSIKSTQIKQLMLQAQFQAERQVYRISRDEAYAQLVSKGEVERASKRKKRAGSVRSRDCSASLLASIDHAPADLDW